MEFLIRELLSPAEKVPSLSSGFLFCLSYLRNLYTVVLELVLNLFFFPTKTQAKLGMFI